MISNKNASNGIFQYASELPQVKNHVSLGEGNTPVIPLPRIGKAIGVPNLFAKLEGNNPTGSYKDRVAAMSISLAIEQGKVGWVATSSGNAGTSLAAYGGRAGLPGFLVVVPSIPREKLLPILALGSANVIKVSGIGIKGTANTETEIFEAVKSAAEQHDLFLGVTAHKYNQQGMQGADTISYELEDAGFNETVVYVPTGGGGLVSAICRGFVTRSSSAKVVAAQPAGCAPIVDYLNGDIERPRIQNCETNISGLQLPSPPDGQLAADTIRKSNGWGASAADEEIVEAQKMLANLEGILVEPASATGLAALINDLKLGRLDGSDSVVLILTATGLKDLSSIEKSVSEPPQIGVTELAKAISDWRLK